MTLGDEIAELRRKLITVATFCRAPGSEWQHTRNTTTPEDPRPESAMNRSSTAMSVQNRFPWRRLGESGELVGVAQDRKAREHPFAHDFVVCDASCQQCAF